MIMTPKKSFSGLKERASIPQSSSSTHAGVKYLVLLPGCFGETTITEENLLLTLSRYIFDKTKKKKCGV
eukprot:m.225491 g.225491  ORF g.225491 m.225491 type:complete len:69 (-) comp26385_c1_seq8:1881-2087(-)